jgi:flavin-dependent dehydrogenase
MIPETACRYRYDIIVVGAGPAGTEAAAAAASVPAWPS